MSFAAFTFIFLLGSLFGAALAAIAVIRGEALRERLVRRWFVCWLKESRRADVAEAKLAAIHAKHVAAGSKGGKAVHQKQRAKVLAKAAEMRAEMNRPVKLAAAA